MNAAFLLSLVLLGGANVPAPRVVVDGLPVPPASVRVVGGRTLVACRWLREVAAGYTCFDARPNGSRSVSVRAVEQEGEGNREVTFTPASTTVRTYRSFNWRDPRPLPERALFSGDVFVPLRALAAGLEAPLTVRGGVVTLGRAPGFARLLGALETGTLAQAREAAQWLKTRSEVRIPQPGSPGSETNDRLTLWPQGEVERQFDWASDVVTYSEIRDGWRVTCWAGKLAQGFLHEERDERAPRNGSDTLTRYLGVPFAQEVGTRPRVTGPLSFAAGHIFGISSTRYWGTVTPEGHELTRLETYWQYGERLVPDGRGGLKPAADPLRVPYGWEARRPRR